MKVSIKNLHISIMGPLEAEAKTAPKEFYSPLERELREDLEKKRIDYAELMTASVTLRSDLTTTQRHCAELRNQRDKLVEAHKAQAEELAQSKTNGECLNTRVRQSEAHVEKLLAELALILEWTKEYDKGQWPDHNAKGSGHVSKEVLHMMRDLWADLESRPLNAGKSLVVKALTDLFDESDKVNNPQWQGSPMREYCRKLIDPSHREYAGPGAGFNPTGWNAPATVQPCKEPDPVGVGQPAPETAVSQPAAPESVMYGPATGTQAPKAKKCPVEGCTNLLWDTQEFCAPHRNAQLRQLRELLPPKETFDIRAALAAKESFGEPGPLLENEAEKAERKKDATRPPCSVPLCDEPRLKGSIYCGEHKHYREPAKRG